LKTILKKRKKKRINTTTTIIIIIIIINSKPQQKSKHRLQQVADYQTVDRLKEGTQIFILS